MSDTNYHAVAADFIFDGVAVHRNAAVVIEGERIAGVGPAAALPRAIAIHTLPDGAWLAPGFIDVQVNGGGDVLFNDTPTAEGVAAIAAAHRKFGTTALLPTLISDSAEKMKTAIDAVEEVAERELGILGIHLEGPFLSPKKPGVHNLRAIRRPRPEDSEMLKAPRKTVTLVTLAPEQVPAGFIAELTNAGVRVSLGHSMASYAQARAAMQEGLRGFTHLFNAMRPLASRDPGPIAAALESPEVWFGLIVDGVHVDPAVLRVALRGAGQPILVTDAMPPVGGRRSRFMLGGEEISVIDGRCTRSDGTLAGAVLDMASAVRNCVSLLAVPLETALRFASTNPANFLGLGHRLGRLAPHYRADMVAFEPTDIEVIETWVAGNSSSARQESESGSPTAARQSILSSRSN
jgi:N-acetylglucosamine-6-phosphate deacetylase